MAKKSNQRENLSLTLLDFQRLAKKGNVIPVYREILADFETPLTAYLKLEGRVAIIDMNNEHPDSPHRDHPDVQVTAAQIKEWMAAAGFRLAEEYYLFERKYFLVFERADPAADHSITGQNSKLHPTVEELVDAAAGCIFWEPSL